MEPDEWFQTMVEDASDGRLIIDTKMNLFKDGNDTVMAVIDGRVDAGRFHNAWASGTFPLWDHLSVPFVYNSPVEFEQARHDPRMMEIYKESYADAGLVQIGSYGCDGNLAVWANKPIRTVEDFKGMKIRASGILPSLNMKAMGAAPITVAGPEIPEAILRGVLDAALSDRSWAFGVGVGDVTTHLNRWTFTPSFANSIVVNKEKFDSLPPDLQQILLDMGDRLSSHVNFTTAFSGALLDANIEGAGLELVFPSDAEMEKARKLCESVADEWIAIDGVGALGAEILEIAAKYRRY